VRVAEMDRKLTRNLGFNWKAIGQIGHLSLGFLSSGALAAAATGFPPTLPTGSSTNLIGGGYKNGGIDINGVIDALAEDNLITVLAEPNLTTQSGEPASFLAGGEFPVPIASGGSNAPGVEFKQFGVSLAFVPTVLSPGRISMRIRPEVSQRDDANGIEINGSLVPSVTTRRAETTVELGSGQSFAIAGLLERRVVNSLSTLPWIGEIPVLGALFRSTQFQREETEVVIIVTPYIVQPVGNAAQLRLPTDGFQPATDLGRLLYGQHVRTPDASGPGAQGVGARGAGATLDAGFILK
jgi:pilus assembly protein CpaC